MEATPHRSPPLGGSSVKLADMLAGRDNNLNAIRMVAASAVLVSHAWLVTGGAAAVEPLHVETGQPLGHFAVAVFFSISGLLIARSYDRRRSLVHFFMARVLRLYPALLAVLLVTVVAGVFITRLDVAAYLRNPATWTYIPANLSLAFMQYPLPGVFEGNPLGPQINGSLWTLLYEVACYFGVVLLGLLGILKRRWTILALMALVSLVRIGGTMMAEAPFPISPGLALHFKLLTLLGFPFMLGTFAYVWREHIRLSGWIAVLLWLPIPLLAGTGMMAIMMTVPLVYTIFWIGFVPKGRALAYNRLGDYSYGIYIYAFPVQQLLVSQFPGMGPLTNIALALPITLVLAVLSWNLVEARALTAVVPLADRLSALLRRLPSKPVQPT